MNSEWKTKSLGKRKWQDLKEENTQNDIHAKLDLLLERVEELLDILQETEEQEDYIDWQSDSE